MRCFLALPLVDDIRDAIAETWAGIEKPTSAIKLISDEHWHLTLAFLGDVEARHIGDLVRVCARHTDAPGSITLGRFETFPPGRARLIVASGEAEPVGSWKLFVDHLRFQCQLFAPRLDRKPWKPHVTIARTPWDARIPLPEWTETVGPWTWRPEEFILYESRLGHGGPTYRAIHRFAFR